MRSTFDFCIPTKAVSVPDGPDMLAQLADTNLPGSSSSAGIWHLAALVAYIKRLVRKLRM
jgi:hypothetical protein